MQVSLALYPLLLACILGTGIAPLTATSSGWAYNYTSHPSPIYGTHSSSVWVCGVPLPYLSEPVRFAACHGHLHLMSMHNSGASFSCCLGRFAVGHLSPPDLSPWSLCDGLTVWFESCVCRWAMLGAVGQSRSCYTGCSQLSSRSGTT